MGEKFKKISCVAKIENHCYRLITAWGSAREYLTVEEPISAYYREDYIQLGEIDAGAANNPTASKIGPFPK